MAVESQLKTIRDVIGARQAVDNQSHIVDAGDRETPYVRFVNDIALTLGPRTARRQRVPVSQR